MGGPLHGQAICIRITYIHANLRIIKNGGWAFTWAENTVHVYGTIVSNTASMGRLDKLIINS